MEAASSRVAFTFDNFERIYLSFSAGKDSTILLHLTAAEARKRSRKFGLLFIDLEAQYQNTIKHAQKCFDMYADCIEPFWCCLPIHLRNAVSVYETHWICWDESRKESWVREMPEHASKEFPFAHHGMEFEEFVPNFGEWYSRGKRTACLVGIRSDESLNRFRTIALNNKEMIDGHKWTTRVWPNNGNVFNVYPIYDWRTADVWTYHARNPKLPYNHLNDQTNEDLSAIRRRSTQRVMVISPHRARDVGASRGASERRELRSDVCTILGQHHGQPEDQ